MVCVSSEHLDGLTGLGQFVSEGRAESVFITILSMSCHSKTMTGHADPGTNTGTTYGRKRIVYQRHSRAPMSLSTICTGNLILLPARHAKMFSGPRRG